MTQHQPIAALGSFFISSVATIAAWQVQLEFWLKITATAVAIIAGIVSIYAALRRKKTD